VSAAQALSPGPVTPSSPPRTSSNAGAEGGDASFRDALETVSRSHDAAEKGPGLPSSDRVRGSRGNRDGADGDTQRDQTGSARAEAITAADLSTLFAALGVKPGADGAASGALAASEGASQPSLSTSADVDALLLAGAEDGGETIDAAKLLALLRSGTARPSDLPAESVTIKVTVAGQETHLALDAVSAEALAALSAARDSATPAEGRTGAALGAALSQSADDAARLAIKRESASAGLEAKSEAGVAPRGVTISEAWSGRGEAGTFADQGIAGQDGRQPDSRGSSGGNSQQQGSGAFAAAMAGGNLRAAAGVGDVPGADAGAEPVSDQIARHVRAELKADGLGDASSDGVVKVLNLELKPAIMGSVTVRIALKDNAITVHLEAQRTETLAVIERERDALTSALASAGYSVDGITAAPQGETGRSLGALTGLGSSGSPAPQGGPFAQGQGLANSSGGQGGSAQAGGGHPSYRHPSDDKDTAGRGIRNEQDGLYV
jgi:chemotaxis protein MotD